MDHSFVMRLKYVIKNCVQLLLIFYLVAVVHNRITMRYPTCHLTEPDMLMSTFVYSIIRQH